MKFYNTGHRPRLELTRRNLETLLAKLDDPTSRRTLIKGSEDGSCVFMVTAVENAEHYAGREPGYTLHAPKEEG